MVVAVAGIGDFTNSGGEVLADAGDLAERVDVESGQFVRVIAGDVGAVPIGANLEWVVALDLEKIGDLVENSSDGLIIQSAGLPSRYGSPARGHPLQSAPC